MGLETTRNSNCLAQQRQPHTTDETQEGDTADIGVKWSVRWTLRPSTTAHIQRPIASATSSISQAVNRIRSTAPSPAWRSLWTLSIYRAPNGARPRDLLGLAKASNKQDDRLRRRLSAQANYGRSSTRSTPRCTLSYVASRAYQNKTSATPLRNASAAAGGAHAPLRPRRAFPPTR